MTDRIFLKLNNICQKATHCSLSNLIMGPLFLEENLPGHLNLSVLQNRIKLITVEIVQVNPDEFLTNVTFVQDSTPAYYYTLIRKWPNEKYSNRWIRKRVSVGWSARSPNMTIFLKTNYNKLVSNNLGRASLNLKTKRVLDTELRDLSKHSVTNVEPQ